MEIEKIIDNRDINLKQIMEWKSRRANMKQAVNEEKSKGKERLHN